MVICYSISVEIVLIVSHICWEKQIHYSQVSLKTSKVRGLTINVQEAAADGHHPVLYDNFYLFQHLPEKSQISISCKLQITYLQTKW